MMKHAHIQQLLVHIHIFAFRHMQLKHSAEAVLDANSIVS